MKESEAERSIVVPEKPSVFNFPGLNSEQLMQHFILFFQEQDQQGIQQQVICSIDEPASERVADNT